MSSALAQEKIVQFVFRLLGSPSVDVELERESVITAIEKALDLFGSHRPKYKMGSVPLTVGTQKYELTNYGRGVVEVMMPEQYQVPTDIGGFDEFSYYNFYRILTTVDLADYYIDRIWWNEMRRGMGTEFDWEFETDDSGPTEKGYLFVSPPPTYVGHPLIYFYVVHPTLTQVPQAYDWWIKQYTLALSMQVLGRIRGKFMSVQGAESTIDLDGEGLKSDAGMEIDKLEEWVVARPSVPPIRG